MYDLKVYSCNGSTSCRNYKNDGLICFVYLQSEPGYILKDRKDSGVQWIFLLKGRLEVSVAEKTVEVAEGEMFLVCSPSDRIKAMEQVAFVYFVSEYPTEYCTKILNELRSDGVPREKYLPLLPISVALERFLELLLIYLRYGVNCKQLFREKQQELFMVFYKSYPPQERERYLFPLTLRSNNALRKSIVEHAFHAKNVQELAQSCGYSLNSFKKVFKEMFNEPIYQWMLKQKAERLKIRLAVEGVNLKEVIHEFGFSSPAHFTKFCKQWLGMIPTKYIEKIKEQQEQLRF